jgi:hypothetical protein
MFRWGRCPGIAVTESQPACRAARRGVGKKLDDEDDWTANYRSFHLGDTYKNNDRADNHSLRFVWSVMVAPWNLCSNEST